MRHSGTRDFRFIQPRCIDAKGAIRQTASVNRRGDERRGYRCCDLRSAPPRHLVALCVHVADRATILQGRFPPLGARERPLNFNSPKFEAARRLRRAIRDAKS